MKFGRLLTTVAVVSLCFSATAHATPQVVPEIDAGMAGSAIAMLVGALSLLHEKLRRR